MSKLDLRAATALALGVGLAVSCSDTRVDADTGAMTSGISMSQGDDDDGDDGNDDDDGDTTMGEKLDIGNNDSGNLPNCTTDSGCNLIDLLFVIDNSGTMGEEQLNLARNFPLLVQKLQDLEVDGSKVNPNVNIMVTTSDFGHPLCTTFQKPDYQPRKGAPVYEGCNARINRFTGLTVEGQTPVVIEEACTASCPADIAPADPFIHFDVTGSNVPMNDPGKALSCIGPQGIDGCGYEAPLETMLQAINDGACWNNPDQEHCQSHPEWAGVNKGFLREDAVLAIAIVTDEVECSVAAPGGYNYFTKPEEGIYWEMNPVLEIPQATSAVCFNAGVSCEDANGDGVYESCVSSDSPALHPLERYTSYLKYLYEERGKEVVMLGILGVPPVTAHNPNTPFEPTAGGVFDLVYRDWINGQYPAGDILPDEWAAGIDADYKRFEFGLGPGCTGQDPDTLEFTGQAIPNTRVQEVCESLNRTDDDGNVTVRCCIESICDTDFSAAVNCLAGIIETAIQPAG